MRGNERRVVRRGLSGGSKSLFDASRGARAGVTTIGVGDINECEQRVAWSDDMFGGGRGRIEPVRQTVNSEP
jgi:hypothetical protein